MKVKIIVIIVLLFLNISVFGDHSEDYKIEIKPAKVINTIAPLIIDVYTDYNSGDWYELRRQIFYPIVHKKYILEKREGHPDSLIEIKKEFWCEYPEVKLPYNEYSRIKTKKVKYNYFTSQPAYPTVSEHIIIEKDTVLVVEPYSSFSIRIDPSLNSSNKKDSIDTENNLLEKKEKISFKEKEQKPKSILQKIKNFFSR
jgi:hypothetical protein